MATSTTITVWCNGCGDWEATGPTVKDARKSARKMGWKVGVASTDAEPSDPTAASLWRPGERRDFCPYCVKAGAIEHDLIKQPCVFPKQPGVFNRTGVCGTQVMVPVGTEPDTVRCTYHREGS